jgi:protein O-GlcNAc transferase
MFKALKNALGLRVSNRQRETATDAVIAPVPEAATKKNSLQLGHAAIQGGNFTEAVGLYSRHITAEPRSSSAHIGLGFALLRLSRFRDAIEPLEKAVALDPGDVDGFYMLGNAYAETAMPEAAERAWTMAHALAPSFEHLYTDFCFLLFRLGKAKQARTLIETGIAHFPENADFKLRLGDLLAESGDHASAVTHYREAVALTPESPQLLSSLGNALLQVGALDEAVDVLTKALELAPDAAPIFSNYLLAIQYSSKVSKAEKFAAAQAFAERFEAPLQSQWGNYAKRDAQPEKLRLGYVSGDFRNHALASFIEPILANHDRSRFEIYCYYVHPALDAVSQRIQGLADHWVHCHALSAELLAARVRADEIDVLIDLSGHTGHNRLLAFARKPAPVQLTWLGYQATTGLKAIDYRVSEEALDPTGTSEKFHSEKLIRLPSSGTFSPSPDSPPVSELPVLGGQPFTFGCLNNPTKITDEALALWAGILGHIPGARLMLGSATPALVARLSTQFQQHGIDTNRLIFQPKVGLVDYLALHHQIDLALDTFPYNGGTTTFHSLWMGVPIIALEGDTTLSKVGTAIMHGMGLSNFCADTHERYVECAVHFARHPEELAAVRRALREKLGKVTDYLAVEVTASLESAIQSCWQTYCHDAQAIAG